MPVELAPSSAHRLAHPCNFKTSCKCLRPSVVNRVRGRQLHINRLREGPAQESSPSLRTSFFFCVKLRASSALSSVQLVQNLLSAPHMPPRTKQEGECATTPLQNTTRIPPFPQFIELITHQPRTSQNGTLHVHACEHTSLKLSCALATLHYTTEIRRPS